jgi:hypothetical protein
MGDKRCDIETRMPRITKRDPGSSLEFSLFQRVGENSRVTPQVILYDLWYKIHRLNVLAEALL